jgi:hypothetical protein
MILDKTSVYRGMLPWLLALAFLLPSGRAEADVVGCVESEDPPIRVCYEDAGDLSMAEEVLGRAGDAWEFFVDGMGFPIPWRLTDEGAPEQGLYFLCTDLSYLGEGVMGWAEPVADVPSTPRSDCAVRININSNDDYHFSRMIVPHEVGRALIMADDCTEKLQDGLAMYLYMVYTKLSGGFPFDRFLEYFGSQYLSNFQANPYLALDFETSFNPDFEMYVYGQALFHMYLDERWSSGSGAIFTDLTAASRQDGTVVITDGAASLESGENEPDLLDALDSVLASRDSSFWDAVKEFEIWRLFTAGRDDGDHFAYGAYLPELMIEATYMMPDLPVEDAPFMDPPAETGATYIDVYVSGDMVTAAEDLLQLSITSTDSMNWHLAAVVFKNDGTTALHESDASGGRGMVLAPDLESASDVVFMALNMGDLVHDPDNPEYEGGSLSYDLDFYTRPGLLSVFPGQVMTGTSGITVEIAGSGFKRDIEVDFGEGITVTSRTVEPAGDLVTAVIDVDGDAPTGLRPVVAGYANGLSAELADAMEVVSGEPPVLDSVSPPASEAGAHRNVELLGDRFQAGMTVAFSSDVTVRRVDLITEGSAIALIDVSRNAPAGARDVTVTNPDGKGFTLAGGFEVLEAREEDDVVVDGDGENGACSCSVAGSGADAGLPSAALLFFLGLAALLFRRKTAGKSALLAAGLFILLAALGAGPAQAAPDQDVSARIARIYELLYPAPTGKAAAPGTLVPSYTANRIEAFRILKTLPEETQNDLSPLFAPPVALDCLVSEIYPVRSCYNSEEEIPRAQTILTWVEETWQLEVEELGFWAPWRLGPSGPEQGMDFYLGDTQSIGAAGYTSPEDVVPSTPHLDCYAYIVIDETFNPADETWKTVVGHELNHGCQMSMDCSETLSAMEATAVWTEHLIIPGNYDYFAYAAGVFQDNPGYSVGRSDYNSMYPYGVSFFVQFIQEFIGGNDPTSIVRLWEGTVQDQELWENEPDFLDAILNLSAESDIDLAGLFSAFGEWRWFVGTNDDGNHFEHGSEWWGVTVAVDGTLTIPAPARFPVTLNGDIQPLGYLFERVVLNTETIPQGALVVRFQGVAASTWDMELWTLKDGVLDRKYAALTDEDGQAELVTRSDEIFDSDDVIFMALNLGDAELDWDQGWRDEHFSATLDYLYYPEVVEISPKTLVPGKETEVTLRGLYFEPDLEARLSGEDAVVTETRVRSGEEMRLTISVDRDAVFGPRDLLLDNYPEDYEGFETTLAGAVEIVRPPAPYISALDPGRGAAGERHILRVDGRYFSPDQWLTMSCTGVSVTHTDFIDSETLFVHIEIPAEALEQTCDITVQDPFGSSFTLFGAFTVTTPAAVQDPVEEEPGVIDSTGGACGCSLVR